MFGDDFWEFISWIMPIIIVLAIIGLVTLIMAIFK